MKAWRLGSQQNQNSRAPAAWNKTRRWELQLNNSGNSLEFLKCNLVKGVWVHQTLQSRFPSLRDNLYMCLPVSFILFTQMMLNSRQVPSDVLTGGVRSACVCVCPMRLLATNGNCSKLKKKRIRSTFDSNLNELFEPFFYQLISIWYFYWDVYCVVIVTFIGNAKCACIIYLSVDIFRFLQTSRLFLSLVPS